MNPDSDTGVLNSNVLTSIVWDWCIDLMADSAICLAVNVTNAHPVGQRHHTYFRLIRHYNELCISLKKLQTTKGGPQTKA